MAVPEGFHYRSDTNDEWLSREDFQVLLETEL